MQFVRIFPLYVDPEPDPRIQSMALRDETRAFWDDTRPTRIDARSRAICSIEIETMNQAAIKKAFALEGCSNSRRRLLRQLVRISLGLPVRHLLALASSGQQATQHQIQQQHTSQSPQPPPGPISDADDQFLNQLEQ